MNTPTHGEFRRVSSADVNAELQAVVEDQLRAMLSKREPGHCMRVSDLDTPVMLAAARGLRAALGEAAQIHVLSAEAHNVDPLLITSSKLVELRNPPAEDSFAEATFEQISVADSYQRLREKLLAEMCDGLDHSVREILRLVVDERNWRWAGPVAVVRFLLSIKLNGHDPEVVGASLCEFGLVPDIHLLEKPGELQRRVASNLECVRTLTLSAKSERSRVLELKLRKPDFRTRLGNFLSEVGLEDPLVWTGQIVANRPPWAFSFDQWEFEDGAGFTQTLRLEVLDVGIPTVAEKTSNEQLRALKLVGQRVLIIGAGGQRSFTVKFRCDPAPERVASVDHFRLQIVSRDSGPTGFTKKKKVWTGQSRDRSQSFTKLDRVDWEEGWHFVRILPYTAAGEPFPIVDARGEPVPVGGDFEGGMPNESDLFYVVVTDELEAEVPQRAVQKFASLSHAWIYHWFKALADGHDPRGLALSQQAWAQSEGKGDLLEAKFTGESLFHVPVSRVLKSLETKMLSDNNGDFVSWRLSLSLGDHAMIAPGDDAWPRGTDVDSFRVTRRALHQKIRGGDGQWIVATQDLFPLRDEIASLAEQYLSILAQALRRMESAPPDTTRQALSDLQTLLAIDTIAVDLADAHHQHRSALLVGPTHPLRLLWLSAWLTLAEQWAERTKNAPDFLTATRETLLHAMSLVNFPAVFPTSAGRLLSAIDNIHPLWTIYASSAEIDPRGLLAEVCTGLNLSEPNIGSGTLGSAFLADRLRRYLVQHPYIHTLTLNCFNPGRGRLLADSLLELQKLPEIQDMRYALRLFTPDPDAVGIGDDLRELISPTSTLTAQEADAFATPTGKYLAPKLAYSVRATDDFRRSPDSFSAHVSLLFDVFRAQGISAQPPRNEDKSASVHGLLQDFTVAYTEIGDQIAWHRSPRHGTALPLPGAPEFSTLLARLAETLSAAAAAVATGQAGPVLRPVSTLVLEPEHRALLHQVHEASDWVFTVDKSLGVEYFDHAQGSRRPEYLIDHSPELAANSGRRVVITSRSQTEVRALLELVLREHQLAEFQDRSSALLSELRALSGRLALKLASSPTLRAEVLGLAFAKMYLEFQEVFQDQVVVPLDAHLELYRAIQLSNDEFADEISLRRTDLALFDFDAANRVLTCSLVEVKCYQSAGGIGAWNSLKNDIAEQITQSEKMLRHHFDPSYAGANDRPDRVMKTQELTTLLEFYVDRAFRLRLLSPPVYDEAKFFLRGMDGGYQLRFTRSALVFDFEKEGIEESTEEGGIEFHRVGIDRIRKLLSVLPAKLRGEETKPFDEGTTTTATVTHLLTESLPKLVRAAFLSDKRVRTVSWEALDQRVVHAAISKDEESLLVPRIPVVPKNPYPSVEMEREPEVASVPETSPSTAVLTVPQTSLNEGSSTIDGSVATESNRSASTPLLDIILGATSQTPQYGILGKVAGHTVSLDLNQTHTISLFGVQGGGKSYTLGTIIEMATLPIPGINLLPHPLATVVFHYSQTQDYKPEFTSMLHPNQDAAALSTLAAEYGANPASLQDIVLVVPEGKLASRRFEYPAITVIPLKFSSKELQAEHWRFLMGAVGNQATYIRRMNQLMRNIRGDLTLDGLRASVMAANLPESMKDLAIMRLDMASTYINDSICLSDYVRPGRLVIVDLRDEFVEKDEALGLFVVLLQVFANAKINHVPFNKLVVFDEAHKYIDNPDLVSGLIGVVREMRHKGTSILLASQDPKSLPLSVIELSSQIILHRFNSPEWLRHIQKANAALGNLNSDQLARLQPGEAFVWSSKSTDQAFSHGAVKIRCRPRVTEHGGSTKTAV